MDINHLQKVKIDKNYIRLSTAIQFIVKSKNLKYADITAFIARVSNNLTLYTLDQALNPVSGSVFCDYSSIDRCFSYLSNADNNHISESMVFFSVDEYFWNKDEFFKNEEIMSIELTSEKFDLFLIVSGYKPPLKNSFFIDTNEILYISEIIEFDRNKIRQENEDKNKTVVELQNRINELECQLSDALSKNTPSINDELHPSLDPAHKNHAPELLLAVQAWEAKYLKNEYPHQEHSPAIKAFLTKRNYSGTRLQDRIAAITNPKDINKSNN